MPELPEVETVRRTLEYFLLDSKVVKVDILYPKIINGDEKAFKEAIEGSTLKEIDRKGKYLIFLFDHTAFLSHLRMEGKYNICDASREISKHDHVIFYLEDGRQVRYNDTRKFGRMEIVDRDHYDEHPSLMKLGKEPFDADIKEVKEKLSKTSLPIKTVLLDQSIMAGIGNIYANEICFAMKLNPRTPANKLKRVYELIETSSNILNKAIEQGGTTIHSFDANGITGLFQVQLNVHGQKVCKVCGNEIKKIQLNGRGTYYCPHCQRRRS